MKATTVSFSKQYINGIAVKQYTLKVIQPHHPKVLHKLPKLIAHCHLKQLEQICWKITGFGPNAQQPLVSQTYLLSKLAIMQSYTFDHSKAKKHSQSWQPFKVYKLWKYFPILCDNIFGDSVNLPEYLKLMLVISYVSDHSKSILQLHSQLLSSEIPLSSQLR